MAKIGIHEAKTHFSKLLRRVARGEKIVITNNGRVVARLVPPERVDGKRFGTDAGGIVVTDDFFAPLPDDIARAFGG